MSDRPLPRLAMLRDLTDRAVLDRLFRHGRTTRAELALETGISKPTISEAVRRLETAGMLQATGTDETGRRGRVATFYELAPDAGRVLALEVDQRGVHGQVADLTGMVLDDYTAPAADTADTVHTAIRTAVHASDNGPVRAIALSVANPVDPGTREVVALPGLLFPDGVLRPDDFAADAGDATLVVDNDVNFSALAERREGAAVDAHSFAYVYIGAGIGASVYIGDQLLRGAHGLAGEVGFLRTDSGATVMAELARLGLGRAGTPYLDVDALLALLDRTDTEAWVSLDVVGRVLGRAVAALCAVADPELVLLGGPAGHHPELVGLLRPVVTAAALGPVRIEPGARTDSAPLRGALLCALDAGRDHIAAAVSAGES